MVLGLAYIFTFNKAGSPLNVLYGTLAILIISNVIHYFTVGFLTATTALRQMDAEFENVSASLGVPFYRTFWRVTVPMALPPIVGISMYFFLNAMVTLSAVVFLVAPGTELAAVAVLLMDDAGDTAQAAAMSVCIIAHRADGAPGLLGPDAGREPAHPGLARAPGKHYASARSHRHDARPWWTSPATAGASSRCCRRPSAPRPRS